MILSVVWTGGKLIDGHYVKKREIPFSVSLQDRKRDRQMLKSDFLSTFYINNNTT
jgi:hypothetical protein